MRDTVLISSESQQGSPNLPFGTNPWDWYDKTRGGCDYIGQDPLLVAFLITRYLLRVYSPPFNSFFFFFSVEQITFG